VDSWCKRILLREEDGAAGFRQNNGEDINGGESSGSHEIGRGRDGPEGRRVQEAGGRGGDEGGDESNTATGPGDRPEGVCAAHWEGHKVEHTASVVAKEHSRASGDEEAVEKGEGVGEERGGGERHGGHERREEERSREAERRKRREGGHPVAHVRLGEHESGGNEEESLEESDQSRGAQ
jgi:hypothetical protein